MTSLQNADTIWERNKKFIPGGVVSLNRLIDPIRVFVRAQGAYIWDVEGRRFIDYHAAFSPYLLGHCDPDVDSAAIEMIRQGASLVGAGTTVWEGELAELLTGAVPSLEQIELTNSGSEATFHALRLARAITGRETILTIQGSYHGWHNDVAFNLMDPIDRLEGTPPGETLPLYPFSGGIPSSVGSHVRVVEFNDVEAVEKVLSREPVAALILEPILQNVGVVKPQFGYLEALRRLCDRHGTLLIFDEVKTGFRHALGGYQSLCGVRPDLSTFGKAVANGYPLGVVGGKREYMEYFNHPDPQKRVLMAGTYNAHPVPVAAAIATIRKLQAREGEIYAHLEDLGRMMQDGLEQLFGAASLQASVARQGSAFVAYFMERAPRSWREIARHHDMAFDRRYRNALIEKGVFHFPVPAKQGSISVAHTRADVQQTLEVTEAVLADLRR